MSYVDVALNMPVIKQIYVSVLSLLNIVYTEYTPLNLILTYMLIVPTFLGLHVLSCDVYVHALDCHGKNVAHVHKYKVNKP